MKLTLDKSTHLLIGILVIIMTVIILTVSSQLYNVAFEEEKARLTETVKSQARLIESVAAFDQKYSYKDVNGGAEQATLKQIRQAHENYQGFGKTGEFTLAKQVDKQIVFLLNHRNEPLKEMPQLPKQILMGSNLAIPMQKALAGESGTIIDKDYRGAIVLAAYEPVAVLDYGIVAKIDLDEIRAPFIRAMVLSFIIGLILIILGSIAFRRITNPLIKEIKAQKDKFLTLLDSTGEAIYGLDPEGNATFINPAALEVLGYSSDEELLGKNLHDLLHHSYKDKTPYPAKQCHINRAFENHNEVYVDWEVFWRKDGTPVPVSYHANPTFENGVCTGTVVSFTDITEKLKAEEEHRLAATVFDNIDESIIVTDENAIILSVNRAFTRLTGYTEEEVVGKNPSLLKSGQQDQAFYEEMWKELIEQDYWQGEIWNRNKDGETLPLWEVISAVKNEQGETTHYVSAFSDISSLKNNEKRLEFLAHHDPLTKLPNRLLFNARFELSLQHAQRIGNMIGILFIDLDDFKPVNDNFGHDAGDLLLKEVANRLICCVRQQDTVSRLGGDEFGILLIDLQNQDEISPLANHILEELNRPFDIHDSQQKISCSIGISLYPFDGIEMDVLLNLADSAMYKAKQTGKNQIVHTQDMS